MTQLITRNDLARMYPNAPSAWLDAFIKFIPNINHKQNTDLGPTHRISPKHPARRRSENLVRVLPAATPAS